MPSSTSNFLFESSPFSGLAPLRTKGVFDSSIEEPSKGCVTLSLEDATARLKWGIVLLTGPKLFVSPQLKMGPSFEEYGIQKYQS